MKKIDKVKEEKNKLKDILIGRIVTETYIDDDDTVILFRFEDGGSLPLIAEGECCATVWIKSINGLTPLYGTPITTFKLRHAQLFPTDDKEHVLEDIFYTIGTKNGNVDIELRSSHSGPYGGWLTQFIGETSIEYGKISSMAIIRSESCCIPNSLQMNKVVGDRYESRN